MKTRRLSLVFAIVTLLAAYVPAHGADKKPPAPTGWCFVSKDSAEAKPTPSERKKTITRLGRGALMPVFEAKQAGGTNWTRVRVVDPAKLTPEVGWVDSSRVESLPLNQFPLDADLLKMLGDSYLDDFTAASTAVARFLLHQGGREPALVCFLGSPKFPQARLQVFLRSSRGFTPGPFMEFPFSELQTGITGLEIRDLLGDGNECLVTREGFNLGMETHGVNMVIRRLEAGAFISLWKAPVEFSNLASFPPRPHRLAPPEKNIGAPGTVTKGDVEFRARGGVNEPVWKGKIEFHAFGREEPVETLSVEKVCAWDGTKFAPLQ